MAKKRYFTAVRNQSSGLIEPVEISAMEAALNCYSLRVQTVFYESKQQCASSIVQDRAFEYASATLGKVVVDTQWIRDKCELVASTLESPDPSFNRMVELFGLKNAPIILVDGINLVAVRNFGAFFLLTHSIEVGDRFVREIFCFKEDATSQSPAKEMFNLRKHDCSDSPAPDFKI